MRFTTSASIGRTTFSSTRTSRWSAPTSEELQRSHPNGSHVQEQRNPVPFVGRIRFGHFPQPFDEKPCVGQCIRVVTQGTVFGVKRHGEAAPLTRIGQCPVFKPRIGNHKWT